MMKYCASCSNECPATLRFCPRCGHTQFNSSPRQNNHNQSGIYDPSNINNPYNPNNNANSSSKYYGVKGWLKFFTILMVFVWPIINAASIVFVLYLLRENLIPENEKNYFIFSLCAYLCVIVGLMYSGLKIWKIETGAISHTKKFLWILLFYNIFDGIYYSIAYSKVELGISGIFWTAVILVYFYKSKRVKNTFPHQ